MTETQNHPLVLSVGGSVLLTGEGDLEYLRALAELLRRIGRERPLVVTTGGGRTAREYIHLARALGLTEIELDELGIDVTRLHARLLAGLVGPPCPAHPPTNLAEAVRDAHRVSPVILGGTEPGHTTDGVAALIAVRLRADRLVNATRVRGVYETDPARDPTARRIDRMEWAPFRRMVRDAVGAGAAGQEFLFDALGAESLARAGIPLVVVHGRDLPNLERALRGEPCDGSRIGPDPR
ncbi:MAG: UMP kinase [Thermoplasmata archaeon]